MNPKEFHALAAEIDMTSDVSWLQAIAGEMDAKRESVGYNSPEDYWCREISIRARSKARKLLDAPAPRKVWPGW